MKVAGIVSGIVVALCVAAPACADTVVYTYDALGRLVTASTSGGTQNGVARDYRYDPAGNRTSVQVTGSNNVPPPDAGGGSSVGSPRLFTVPLLGLAPIYVPS
jgi:YD repeat-containing protein